MIESKLLSVIELNNGYYTTRMAEEFVLLTTFTIFYEHYKPFKTPFEICNAPKTFQMAINRLLENLSFIKSNLVTY